MKGRSGLRCREGDAALEGYVQPMGNTVVCEGIRRPYGGDFQEKEYQTVSFGSTSAGRSTRRLLNTTPKLVAEISFYPFPLRSTPWF